MTLHKTEYDDPTPETDEVHDIAGGLEPEPGLGYWLLLCHARKMERERDEAINHLWNLCNEDEEEEDNDVPVNFWEYDPEGEEGRSDDAENLVVLDGFYPSWLSVGDFSLRVSPSAKGVLVQVYRDGFENLGPISTAWAYNEEGIQ